MKKSLLLYLFILSLLLNLFTYMYLSKSSKSNEQTLISKNKKLSDSLKIAKNKLSDADYFSLEKNENAQNYFDNAPGEKVIQYEKLIPYVTEKLLDYNGNPKGNPYVGQDQVGASKFVINKVKILNHRWIIAEFSDGEYWGEVLLKYFVNEDESIDFEVNQSLLYQK
ncbi:MAG: hypothetical protein V4548_07760 [Bacteroidota bacterium]